MFFIDRRECRQIEVALVAQAHDSKVVHFMPCTTIEDAVAEGKEAFVLPTELRDWFSRFSSFIEELLEASQLFLFCQPDIVTDTLYLLFETAETDEVFGFELNDTLIMIFVLNLEETERV